jgi:uncharacterized protein (TIGR03086 family)
MDVETFERAAKSTAGVLAGVDTGALGGPTPCASWDVRQLLNHVVGVPHFFAAVGEGGEPPSADTDFASGDFQDSYRQACARVVQAFSAPGAMERTCRLPIGDMPGHVVLSIASTDTFVHGWDLARATGQSTDLDPELAERLLENARRSVPESYRGEDGKSAFGPEVEPPADAKPADRLAAFLGRRC